MNAELLARLVDQHGSPLYVYEEEGLRESARRLSEALPVRSRIFFSLKANPSPGVVECLGHAGCDAEVSSWTEIRTAMSAGISAARMIFTGPAKRPEEIARALAAGLALFSVESLPDLIRVNQMCAESGRRVRVLLRVNPELPPQAGLAMAGTASQFGFEEKDVVSCWTTITGCRHVRVAGLHIYLGSQIMQIESLAESFRCGIEIAERLSRTLNHRFDLLDLGGGFPAPHASPGERFDLSPLRPLLEALLETRERTRQAEICFESGRFLCGPGGSFATRIMDVKRSKNRTFVVTDGGINHLGGMAGLGRIPRSIRPVLIPRNGLRRPEIPVDIVGPLCSPLDWSARNIQLPEPEIGDLLWIANVGAYGLTASLTAFLGHEAPLEILWGDGHSKRLHRLQSHFHAIEPAPLVPPIFLS